MSRRDATVLMIGETHLVLQKFERFFSGVLMTITTTADGGVRLQKALHRDKETLGRLLHYFAERTELPDDFANTLDRLLEQRNTFVHSLFMQPWFDLKTNAGCEKLDRYMAEIRFAAKSALHIMLGAIHARETRALCSSEAQIYIDAILARVQDTAEPYFGGLTENQYIAKVISNARKNFLVNLRRP